jgi:hypothetical protein
MPWEKEDFSIRQGKKSKLKRRCKEKGCREKIPNTIIPNAEIPTLKSQSDLI